MTIQPSTQRVAAFDPIGAYLAESKETVTGILTKCREQAAISADTRKRAIDALHEALRGILELFQTAKSNPAAAQVLQELYKENGINIDGRTKNDFTPLVKLVFGRVELSSNINRNAAALRYAHEQGVDPAELSGFLTKGGGVAKCANLLSAPRAASGEDRHHRQASMTPAGMMMPNFPVPIALPAAICAPHGLFWLLVERETDGEYHVLGIAPETEQARSRYCSAAVFNVEPAAPRARTFPGLTPPLQLVEAAAAIQTAPEWSLVRTAAPRATCAAVTNQ
jgi:hypothetical protein